VSYRITWIDAQRSFEATGDETVLEAAQRAGVTLPSECGFGGCGTCRVKLIAGHVHYAEPPMALSPEETEAGYALICRSASAFLAPLCRRSVARQRCSAPRR
jgi:CDP-4-dehydro-6-deoxyglucose reductase